MNDTDKKKYEVEWSFSFEKIGDRINQAVESIATPEEAKTMTICEPRGNARTLEFHLHPAVGRTTVSTTTNPDCLIDGTLTYIGEIEFGATGDENRVATLKNKQPNKTLAPIRQAIGAFKGQLDLRWEIGLTPAIPTRLFVHGGVGPAKIDLSAIDLTELRLDGGVGETDLNLPAMENSYNVTLHGGVGQNTLYIPANAAINLRIDGGVGQTTVHVAPNTAVRVVAGGGLGGVSVSRNLKQVKKSGDFMGQGGVWESEGFALAGRQVTIEYKGGVGAFNLVQEETTYV